MDLRRLQNFVTLLDVGSYVDAAARLNLTQSALSHSMRSLEEQAGVVLLDKTRRGVMPTTAGRLLEEEARAILQRMAHVRHNLKVVAGLEAATVRFGMAPLPACLWLSRLLTEMVDTGEVVSSATVGHAAVLAGMLEREAIDFFVCARAGLERPGGMEIEPLGTLAMALLVRRDHPLAGRHGTLPSSDLGAFALIGMGPSFLRGDPNEPAPPFRGGRFAVQTDDFNALIQIALNSDAILLGAPQLTKMSGNALVMLPPADIMLPQHQHLVCVRRPGRELTPAARLVLERLAAIAQLPG